MQDVRLAKPNEVEEITGFRVGSVSLIHPGLPTIIDRGLFRFPYIYGGTGEPQTTLKIQPGDIEPLVEVVAYLPLKE